MGINRLMVGKNGSRATPVIQIRGDSDTHIIRMEVPRFYGGVDLAALMWMVTAKNANGATEEYVMDKTDVSGSIVGMDWKLRGTATAAEGVTEFMLAGFSGENVVWQSGTYRIRIDGKIEHVPGSEEETQLNDVQQLILYVTSELDSVVEAGQNAKQAAAEALEAAEEAREAAHLASTGIESVVQTTTSTVDGGVNIITVTKTDGERSTFEVRNGRQGSQGIPGTPGEDGTAVTITDISESTEDEGENIITFSDGSQITVRNGSQGIQGLKGDTGAPGKNAYQYAQEGGYTGTEAQFAAKLAMPVITPEMYGAVGDGSTDDSAAIQAAINAAGSNAVVYMAKKTYAISTGLILNQKSGRLVCDGTIAYSGTDAAVSVRHSYMHIQIFAINAPNGTGLRLDASGHTVETNEIHVERITGSKVGLHLYTNNSGALYYIQYNRLYIGEIMSSQTCVYSENHTCWINENWYYLGRMGGGASVGIWLQNAGGDGTGANKFMSGGIEGLASTGTAIRIEGSSYNVFRNIRCAENYGATRVKFVGTCDYNDIETTLMDLTEVDISELADIGGGYNIMRGLHSNSGAGRAGIIAFINKRHGITYIPSYRNDDIRLYSTTFADNVIKQVGSIINTSFRCDDASLDGKTLTLGTIYSDYGSACRGFPLTFYFGASTGKLKLIDANGATILDNTSGKYCGKTMAVKWCGYNAVGTQNAWIVQEIGAINATEAYVKDYAQPKGNYLTSFTESDPTVPSWAKQSKKPTYTASEVGALPATTTIPSKTSQLTNDSGFLTQHQDISGKADKSSAETWTFTLANGSTVTKKVVLA